MAATATQHEFEKHINLISKKVEVYSVPGFETIGYDDWFSQCENEFKEKLIKHIETVDNTKSATDIKIIISFEQDEPNNETAGCWRITQEKILSGEELTHDKNRDLN